MRMIAPFWLCVDKKCVGQRPESALVWLIVPHVLLDQSGYFPSSTRVALSSIFFNGKHGELLHIVIDPDRSILAISRGLINLTGISICCLHNEVI